MFHGACRWHVRGRGALIATLATFGPVLALPQARARLRIPSVAMSDSERREIGAAIEAFHASGWDARNVTCVRVEYAPESRRGRSGAEYAWTPWALSIQIDQTNGSAGRLLARQLELLRRHGYLERIEDIDGRPTYGMTWQGFAASDGQGCLHIASEERTVAVHGDARSPRPGMRGVSATATPVSVEPIVHDPEFEALFTSAAYNVLEFDRPATYGLGRYEDRLIVLVSRSHNTPPPAPRPEGARREPRLTRAETARRAGPIDAQRLQALIAERLKNFAPLMHAPISRVCLYLPIAVDESNVGLGPRPPGVPLDRERSSFLDSLRRIGASYRGQMNHRHGRIEIDITFELVRYRMDLTGVELPEVK